MSATLKIFISQLSLIILLAAAASTNGQGRQNYYKIADEAFERGYYQQALDLYQKLLLENPDTTLNNYPYYPTYRGFGYINIKDIKRIQYQIADCYRNLKDYENWLVWAGKAKALNDKEFPLAQFYYASSLMSAGKYLQAQEEFREFNSQITEFSPKYQTTLTNIASTEFALNYLKRPDSLNIQKSNETINAGSSNFGVYVTPDGSSFAFSSTISEILRDTIKEASIKKKTIQSKENKNKTKLDEQSKNSQDTTTSKKIKKKNIQFKNVMVSRIFTGRLVDNRLTKVEMLDIPVKNGVNIGTPCFNKSMNKVFFTLWDGSKISTDCGIYYSVKNSKGEWTKPKELNRSVNIPKSRSMSPFYVEELNLLFFSSNRSGGQGGYDIWYVSIDSTNNAYNLTNAGKNVNTVEDEMGPYYDVKNMTLYFSSSGHVGMGGYDFYRSEGAPGNFSTVTNLGYPLNSSRDEQFYFPDATKNKLYFSSDRTDCKKGCSGPACLNIYEVEIPDYTLKGKTLEFGKRKEIPNAKVTLRPIETPEKDTASVVLISNENGKFTSGLKKNSTYELVAEAKGYETSEPIVITTKNLKRIGISVDTFILLRKIIVLKSEVANAETFVPLAGAKVSLYDNKTNKLIATTISDSLGNYTFDLQRNKDYKIVGRKKGYLTREFRTTTEGVEDTLRERRLLLYQIVLDKPIVIENIFYDYNKATLRPESSRPLDSLANLLLYNPGLTVEIGAHTDSKGEDKYNLKLSDKRAESVVTYLVKKGVPRKLLISKGYGETQPLAPNNNPDGSDNPENRQINRRTEFKIVKVVPVMDEKLE